MELNKASQGGQDTYKYGDSIVEKIQSVRTNDIKQNSLVETNENKSSGNQSVSEKDAKKAVDKVNKLLEDSPTHIEYEQDKKFKSVMVMSVVDNNTNQVITEIPSKKFLDMVAQICQIAGFILDKKA